jgi:hypothetical protein
MPQVALATASGSSLRGSSDCRASRRARTSFQVTEVS